MASETLSFNLFARDNASRTFSKFGATVGDTESKFSKFGSGLLAVGKLAATGAVAIGGLGAAGALMGLKVAASNEQAMISFTTMLGSAKKAGAFLKDLQAFAAKTPFEFPELQTAASSLISAGFQAKKVIPIMTTLGDVTSGMGTGSEGVKRATVALQQMSAAGRITGEDLNQLRDAGVPVFDLLSAATGKSKEAISAMAQSGKLGKTEMQALFKALETGNGLERFNGLMEKQAQSLTGLWSTFKDTLGQGLANAITPLIPLLKDGLGGASEFLGKALARVPEILAVLGPKLSQVGGFITTNVLPAVQSLAGWFQANLVPAIQRVAADLLPKLQGMFASVSKTIQDHKGTLSALGQIITGLIIPTFGKVVGVLVDVLGPAFRGVMVVIRDVLIPVWATLVNVVLTAAGIIVNAAAKAFGWVKGLGPKLKGAAEAFNKFRTDVQSQLDQLVATARGTGEDFAAGVAEGIRDATGLAVGAAGDMSNRIAAQARATLQENSPSKVGIEIGGFFAEGVGIGIKNKTAVALEATKALVDKALAKLVDLRDKARTIAGGAADAVRGMFDFGGIGATTTTSGGTDADGNALPDVSSTASPVAQFADFAARSQAFAGAVSRGVALGLDPRIVAAAVGTGNLAVVQSLANLDPASASSVNRDFALAQKFASQVGQTVLSTTGLPADIARAETQLQVLREIKADLAANREIRIVINDATDPDAVVAAIRRYIRRNGLLRNVAAP